MKVKHRMTLTTKYVLAFGALLLAANIILGVALMAQATSAMSALVRKNMLDISTAAAALLDGDKLAALSKEDVDGPVYRDVLEDLTVFQENIDIEYIYAVRQVSEDKFIFTVDADPVAPADFGEEVLITPALLQAAEGIASVDSAPAQDEWGNFYTAYSPVLDSEDEVVGIIGVDFDAQWYDDQIHNNTISVGVISVLSVVAGAGIILLITSRVSRGFRDLDDQLSALSADVVTLTEELTANPGYRETVEAALSAERPAGEAPADEIAALGEKIGVMQGELQRYLAYLRAQAGTDALTGLGNTTACREKRKVLDSAIRAGTASFALAVFDVDDLKGINDRNGHACGDMVIGAAGAAISSAFGRGNSFRVGGDEFLVIVENASSEDMVTRLELVEQAVADFNASDRPFPVDLSLSMGAAVYRPGEDADFQSVFVRADATMYRRKGANHRRSRESDLPEPVVD